MDKVVEDLENIRKKLIEHVKSTYEPDKAEEFSNKISQMDDVSFVEFLKQQGLLNEDGTPTESSGSQNCIFCSIVKGDVPSTKIGENDLAVSILELNPISKGHSLIIPKKHVEEGAMPTEIMDLANEIAEKLKAVYSPAKIDFVPGNVMGHQVLNVLPIYSEESMESPRMKKSPEELIKMKEEIDRTEINKEELVEEEVKIEKEINEENTWLPRRLP